MKNRSLAESFSELSGVIKSYVDARIRLWKISLLEKLAKTGTYFFSMIIGVVVIASILLLLVFAFSFWYGEVFGNTYEGFLISAGFYAVIGILVFLFRRTIFTNSIIGNIGKILFTEDEDN